MTDKNIHKTLAGVKRRVTSRPTRRPSIATYQEKGVSMFAGQAPAVSKTSGPIGGKRGKIKGWSMASRRRMRVFLLTHEPEEGFRSWGMTLTVPGCPDAIRARETFKDFSRVMVGAGFGAVWRVEVQKRGALHWHLMAALPEGVTWKDVAGLWIEALGRSGSGWYRVEPESKAAKAVERDIEKGKMSPGVLYRRKKNGELWVAWDWWFQWILPHVVQGDGGGNKGAWLRYLQDHATKCKQDQLAENIGRHWGVIGRSHFQAVHPTMQALSPSQYDKVKRWAQRLATPRVKDDRSVFGRRAGYRIRRGGWGRSVWFTRPETVQRMIDFVKSS